MHAIWTKAKQFPHCKETHQIFPPDDFPVRRISFTASFNNEPPAMSLILGWEYGRLWLKEHKEFITSELTKSKPQFIEPDFVWWTTKRNQVLDRRGIFLKKKQNPHAKNCNLAAFATSKAQRLKRLDKIANAETETERGSGEPKGKAKKCNCKDCMQRRCGGEEIVSGSYGPDNRKVFYVTKKLRSIPWYWFVE